VTWIQFLMALPVALLGVVLFHDFMAGLGEERLWGEPVDDGEPPAVRPGSAVAIAPVEALPPVPALKKAG
jgi:hypothetical protein